jgi:flagellar export protein FliJ
MARFRFQLEPVLAQRQRVEDRCKLVVADLERQRLEIERALRELQDGIVRERSELRRHLGTPGSAGSGGEGGPVELRDAKLQAAAAFTMDLRARQEVLRLAGLHKRLEAARSELLKATTARKAVDLLKERRWEAWRLEQSRVESAGVDEMAVMRAHRKEDAP